MSENKKAAKNKKSKPLFPWMNKNHRLVLVNDLTITEEKSWTLSPFNVWLFVSITVLGVMLFTILLIKFTALGSLVMPSKSLSNSAFRKEMEILYLQLDSLDRELKGNISFVESLKKLSSESFEYEKDVKRPEIPENPETVKTFADVPKKAEETKQVIEQAQNTSGNGQLVQTQFLSNFGSNLAGTAFQSPVSGIVSDTFAPSRGHLGTDVTAPKGSVIKAVKSGTVIMATWSADTGHMIGIQHEGNLISWYKHNSANLKKVGDRVSAGEAIAIIGNSGEMSSGPHLHFELWYNGQPINAQNYITF